MLLLLFRIDIILYQQEYFAPSKLFATPLWLPLRNFEYNYEDTWEALRVKQPKVEWSKLVWFSFPIPRHYFFLLFSKRLWCDVMLKCSSKSFLYSWEDILSEGLITWKCKSFLGVVCKLDWGSRVYNV
jgi:hypothetical protein